VGELLGVGAGEVLELLRLALVAEVDEEGRGRPLGGVRVLLGPRRLALPAALALLLAAAVLGRRGEVGEVRAAEGLGDDAELLGAAGRGREGRGGGDDALGERV
jgi:hypothetical protein